MWKMIDYKERNENEKKSETIKPKVIDKYFQSIFQAEHLHNNPTIADVEMNNRSYDEH